MGKIKKKMEWTRKIIHVDMDAFFAAVEQRDNPEFRGKPVIVGGNPFSRGVVSTCSYEARKFGVHSAMPAREAKRLCPEGIFLRPNFLKYEEVSKTVMGILRRHTDKVEALSLDEAYLDVTRHQFGLEDPVMAASLIKQSIHAVTQLTASAGVAPNPFLAKVASDMKKPDGLMVVRPEDVRDFLIGLPVRKIPGVGPVTEKQLQAMNISTCGDLAAIPLSALVDRFGKAGVFLYHRARGQDDSEVEPDTPPKQCSSEETFAHDIRDIPWLQAKLRKLSGEVFEALQEQGRFGRTVVLKVKYFDFELITRSCTLSAVPRDGEEICQVANRLLVEKTKAGKKPVRLLGVGISNLEDVEKKPASCQQDLFGQKGLPLMI